jgi:erythromycin esterase
VQWEQGISIGPDGGALASIEQNNLRDRHMAENVSWILDQAGNDAKIVLWAHNEHVTTQANNTSMGNPPIVRMGQHLREKFGDEYVAFGFDFYGGYFNAFTLNNEIMGALQQQEIMAAPEDSYEYGFASTGIPRMFLDLRGLQPGSPTTDWLLGPRRFRAIGAGYDRSQPDAFLFQVSLPKKFDVIVYFENTTAAK